MGERLDHLYSIINDKINAKDKDRAFTFIEFIKEFGYDNTPSSFLNTYKIYLTQWSNKNKLYSLSDDKEFVRESLIDTLKSIILSYSSYEEQDFIAHIDWHNEEHKKAIVPFFAEKIKNLCDFYKTKRNETPFIVNKNKLKGSRTSLEQIIFDKIVDFSFGNKDLHLQLSDYQTELSISIEQYVDIYSDYFDIPRNIECTDESRAALLEVNINNVNYKDYIKLSQTITELLYNGEVYLEEIPLVAQIALDLSQQCAGEYATLRDNLLEGATINRVPLTEQIALRRRLYEKYLGCDLYYVYCEDENTIFYDLLTKAENPSGNLLNCGTADTAVVESSDIKLLSHIGLFFKPDKTGILKINSDNFKWEVDKSKIKDDTFYVFPDPYKYGDIGNNKDLSYPLIFECKLDNYVKNLSSGGAKNEPLAHIGATTWNTYYSAQDRDYILNDNKDFSYSFTSLANLGLLTNYQRDSYGLEFGLFKGCEIIEKDGIKSIKWPSYILSLTTGTFNNDPITDILTNKHIIISGGIFEETPKNRTNQPSWDANFKPLANRKIVSLYSKNDFKEYPKNNNKKELENISSFFIDEEEKNNSLTSYVKINAKRLESDWTLINSKLDKGELYCKFPHSSEPPKKIIDLISNKAHKDLLSKYEIINYGIFGDYIILETKDNKSEIRIFILKEEINVNGTLIIHLMSSNYTLNNDYSLLYNEKNNQLIIADSIIDTEKNIVKILIYKLDFENNHFINKPTIDYIDWGDLGENYPFNIGLNGFSNYHDASKEIRSFKLSYNNNLDTYLISYILYINEQPWIYHHCFKIKNNKVQGLSTNVITPTKPIKENG